jgi:hypothetical protein
MGSFSKPPQQELTAALDRDYVRVRFQQGKPALDRDLNLAADLAAPQRLASRYLGNGIAGTGTGADFAISGLNVAANDFAIAAGRALVNGLEAVLRANTTYRTQPSRTQVGPLPAGGANIYLRVTEREVTAQEDPLLRNGDDVTFETAVRDKVEWEVIVSQPVINAPDHLLLAVITNATPPALQDRRRLNLSLAAVGDRMNVAHNAVGGLLANVVGAPQIAAQAVTQDKLAANAVSVAQLKRIARFNGATTVQPGAENSVNAFVGNRHATLMTSVTITSAGPGSVTWREFAAQVVVNNVTTFTRGVRVQNLGTTPVTVDVEIFELLAT